MRKPEAIFQSKVIAYLKKTYGPRLWIVNTIGGIGQRAGIPDLLCSINGRFVALEIKNPDGTGRLGPKQEKELQALRDAGAVAEVVSSWDDLRRIIEQFEPQQRIIA